MKAKMMLVSMCVLVLGATSCKKKVDPTDDTPKYSNVKITKIRVEAMSFTDPKGAGWDLNSGPDVKVSLLQAGNKVVDSDAKKDAVQANLPLEWNLSQAFAITNFDTEYQVKVDDQDTGDIIPDDDDLIGAYNFKASSYTSNYPTSFVLEGNNGLKVVLDVQWY